MDQLVRFAPFSGIFRGFAAFCRRRRAAIPFAAETASAGFPSPADDYLEEQLDLNDLIIEDEAATFMVRVRSDSMEPTLFAGDIAVINRAKKATSGCVVLGLLDGDFTLKRFFHRGRDILLKSDNRAYADIVVTADRGFEVWGVVRRSIRLFP